MDIPWGPRAIWRDAFFVGAAAHAVRVVQPELAVGGSARRHSKPRGRPFPPVFQRARNKAGGHLPSNPRLPPRHRAPETSPLASPRAGANRDCGHDAEERRVFAGVLRELRRPWRWDGLPLHVPSGNGPPGAGHASLRGRRLPERRPLGAFQLRWRPERGPSAGVQGRRCGRLKPRVGVRDRGPSRRCAPELVRACGLREP
mmetsp:Transcript_70245/g.195527  ORF Transcript_70245/g.195527 Transcript_70245/m.195527 type:complete len:201 (+) Transcript_70245:2676-3278(+)